jgi:hypothetical protein
MKKVLISLYLLQKYNSSLNVFDDGSVLLRSVIWTPPPPAMFQGMVLPSSSGETYCVGSGRSS